MIRVYFIFKDPFDDTEVNLSYADVPTQDASGAFRRVQEAASSGELWRLLFPENEERPYSILHGKMAYLDISTLTHEATPDTILPI